ncbi:MAG: hypothetical protein WC854_13975 [Bacteroidales bacterium]
MGLCPDRCCCTCEELLGVGTDREIVIGDNIRVFTTAGAAGPVPFQGELVAVEDNAIVIDPPGVGELFVRICCGHIAVIELTSRGV